MPSTVTPRPPRGRPRRGAVVLGGRAGWDSRGSRGSIASSTTLSVNCAVGGDALCRMWRTPGVGAVSCSSTGSGRYRAPGAVIHSLGWLSRDRHTSHVRTWRGAKGGTVRQRQWHASGSCIGLRAVAVIHLHAVSGTIAPHSRVPMPSACGRACPCTRGKYGPGRAFTPH